MDMRMFVTRDKATEHVAVEVNVKHRCAHFRGLFNVPAVMQPGGGCRECLSMADNPGWLHLRKCLTCGDVLCCDNSPMRHSTAHFHQTGHPLRASAEPGETWAYCYSHDKQFTP